VSTRAAAPALSSRTLLLTGKGGVGKTTVAAATAVHLARRGVKTLVLSTDQAHSLGDALARPLGPVPQEVEPGLFGLQVDPRARLESHWRHVQEHLVAALDELGVDRVAAEELTVLPAAEEVLALLELRDQVRSGTFDAVVVDCAPTAETLRLLALPEALSLYLARAVPVGRRVARAVRTGLAGTGRDPVLEALHRLAGELADVRAVLTDPATSVRLVLTPDTVVLAEARRSYTALSLHGYVVDAAVVNRLVPPGDDPWRTARAAREGQVLREAAEAFAGMPLLRSPHTLDEPVGPDALAEVAAAVYADDDPMVAATGRPGLRVDRDGDGFVLVLRLPLARREELDLARRGDDLVVEIDGTRRMLHLPSALRRCRVRGASLREGELRVRFEPDPELWRPL
jgi:arsenite-transporting ATPase